MMLGNPLKLVDLSGLDGCQGFRVCTCKPCVENDDPSACGDDGSGDFGGGPSGGYGGGTFGGPIWTEQIPIYNGPQVDPRLIIYDWTKDANGNMIGDPGERLCLGGTCFDVFWDSDVQRWVGGSANPAKDSNNERIAFNNLCVAEAKAAAAEDFDAAKTMPKARTILGKGLILGFFARLATGSSPLSAAIAGAAVFGDNVGGAVVGSIKYGITDSGCRAQNGIPNAPPSGF